MKVGDFQLTSEYLGLSESNLNLNPTDEMLILKDQ